MKRKVLMSIVAVIAVCSLAKGTTWHAMESGTTEGLMDVWGTGSDNIFAVGLNGTILHYDGNPDKIWEPMVSPTTAHLRAVWGSSADDIWAVGFYGGIILRRQNKGPWEEIIGISSDYILHDVWGSGPNDVYAVGEWRDGMGSCIFHWNGESWTDEHGRIYGPLGSSSQFNGIWGRGPDEVFVVGHNGVSNGVEGVCYMYDGNDWSWGWSGSGWPQTRSLYGVWGTADEMFIGGESFGGPSDWHAQALHYNGSEWETEIFPDFEALNCVWGTAQDNVYMAGYDGKILHYNGSTWSDMDSGTTEVLGGIWGDGLGNVFAVGGNGTILHLPELTIAGYIDWVDLAAFVDKWLEDGCLDANDWCGFADINRDENVDFVDFALLAQYWEDTAPVPGQASNPEPNDTATDVSITADLSWTAGSDAAAHGVYFGTNPTPDANEFQGYQTSTTFTPGILDVDTTYYWRVDEVGLGGETTGDVWSFTTAPAPGQASNPIPRDGASIDGNIFLSGFPPETYIWTNLIFEPGVDAVSHEGFFSDNLALVEARDESVSLGAPPNPGTPFWFFVGIPAVIPGFGPYNDSLVRGTTYYWCVDETDSQSQLWQGAVWSFTIRPGEAWDPDPYDFEELISVTPVLRWEQGAQAGMSGPHEHDIYFSNSFEDVNDAGPELWFPAYQGTQPFGDEDWEPVADGGLSPLDPNTNYYWRIDEVHCRDLAPVVFKGEVWSFTTEAPSLPGQASNPNPTDTATGVSITADLSWTAGYGATSHDVYFGTDPTPDVGEFQGNQSDTTFEPGTLDYEITYYWRIDEVGPGGMTTGVVWSFTTEPAPVPGQASNPNPTDTATSVSITADLSWTAGSGATSHDVYFGTDPTPDVNEFQGNQTNTAFDPGALNYETTYYWRIDEIGPGGTTTGEVWSFTTMVDPNLVGWWKFDETSGVIAYDSSGNENHGMLVDGIGDGLVWVPTQGALNFDGSNNLSRVVISTIGMSTTAGTITIWANLAEPQIRGDGRNGSGYFFGCDNGAKDKILLYMDNSNTQLDIRVGDHSENNIITLGTEVWYHIALTWNGGVYAVYVNGSERGTGSYGGLTSLPSTADIGNNGSSSKQSFHGLMGDVQLYDKSLSVTEIQELCQDGAN